MSQIDLRSQKVITGRDVEAAVRAGATGLRLRPGAVLTPTARDLVERARLAVTSAAPDAPPPMQAPRTARPPERDAPRHVSPVAAFRSPRAAALKEEIVRTGRKLWERQYVDGNGGNLTCRLTDDWVLCTPTLLSKGDVTADDICMVDLDGNQVAGSRKRSSEVLLHLEIMKAVPEARSVIHCHPPHATAYAIAGLVPVGCTIAEHEVFIGPVALAPYETPGTIECARAVVPYVKDHNTVLLANHGIVCWADTVTHAEWYVEVMDTTCRILILAAQMGVTPGQIPSDKVGDLLDLKKRLGMPDARFGGDACALCEAAPEPPGIALAPGGCPGDTRAANRPAPADELDAERLVALVTDKVLAALNQRSR
jgi:L-fuculose-phosphate aldolase